MEFHFLVDVEFLAQLDEDAVYRVEVVAVVATSRCKVQNQQVIAAALGLHRLVVLVPFCQ